MAAPVATWTGGPVVTFPAGCSDPPFIHVEFDAPTYDRVPGHIPVSYIVLGETLGPTFGVCLPTPSPAYELQVPAGGIVSGILPSTPTGRWFGFGARSFSLYIDGVFIRDIGPVPDGAHVSFDQATGVFGYLQPDWSQSHTFQIRVGYEDIPAWKTWTGYGYEVVCKPIEPVLAPSPVYPWAIGRADFWPAGFDPGGGINWGPFGTDVPTFPLAHTVQFFPPTAPGGEEVTAAVEYEFDSPISTTACAYAGFYDPAAGATVTDNAPPGSGGDPTATPGVTLTTAWSCLDSQSFLFTGAKHNTASPPYDTAIGAAEPAYLQHVTAGSQDIWYYQSALLYLPPRLAAHRPDGDAWMVMGVRTSASAGPDVWNNSVVGLMLDQSNVGVFTISTFLGSPDSALPDPLFFGTPVTVSGSGPHCLQLAIRRNSVGSPSLEWTFQLNDEPLQSLSTNAIYVRPAYALWGILDNVAHDDSGDPLCPGCFASVFYIDDLHFDTVAYGCRCASRPNAIFDGAPNHRAD